MITKSMIARTSISSRVGRLLCATALVTVAGMPLNPLAAAPAEFNIKSQPLAQALIQFSRQSKQVVVAPGVNSNVHLMSNSVTGAYEPQDALKILLKNSGFAVKGSGDGSYAIVPSQDGARGERSGWNDKAETRLASNDETSETALNAASSDVAGDQNNATSSVESDFDEIIVNAKRVASTATRFQLSVIDTPQSIKAVTGDVLDFASIQDFTDLVKIDASTNTNGTIQGRPHLSFRGLDMNSSTGIKIDGTPSLAGFPVDFAVFERIEILKGPSSTIYGQNSVGGMVNAVSKRPLSEFKGSVQGKVGSFDFYRAEADVGGPLTQDGRLKFRGVAAYEEGGNFVDFMENQSKVAYGALEYDFDESTSATVIVNYQERRFTPNKGIALFYDTKEVPDIPLSRNFGPDWARADGKILATEAEVSHKFPNNWTLKANVQYSKTSRAGTGYGFFGFVDHNGDGVTHTGAPVDMEVYFEDSDAHMWSADLSLTGDFELFGNKNTFYVGVDNRETDANYKRAFAGVGRPNIFDPTGMHPPLLTVDAIGAVAGHYGNIAESTQRVMGGTAQLLLHPIDRLSILAGARWDKSKTTSDTWLATYVPGDLEKGNLAFPTALVDTKKFVPQIGATFELMPELNLYANYGKSFTPQFGRTFEGVAIQPEEGSQIEGGIKGNFGATTATLAIFDIKRTHIAGVDPEHPTYQRDIGSQETKGVEVDVFGNILPGWTVYGSFAYLDGHVIASGKPIDIGARLFNVPKYSISLYTDYQFKKGPLSGLGLGGGVVSKQDRVWGLPSFPWTGRQYAVGGYTTFDLRASYEIGQVKLDVKVNNVTNEKYYNAFFPGLKGGIYPGRPREVIGSVKYNF